MDWEHPGRKRYWSRNHSHIAQSVPLEDALIEDPIQVMFNGGVDQMRELWSALRADLRGCSIQMTEYASRDFSLVDVLGPGDVIVDALITKDGARLEPERHIKREVKDRLIIPDHLEMIETDLARLESALKPR